MSTTDQAHSSVADIDQLCINTIRTLSIDAVQAGEIRTSGHADGTGAPGLHHLEPGHAIRSEGSRSGPIVTASCSPTVTPPCCCGRCCT